MYEARRLAQETEDLNKFLNIQLEIGIIHRLVGNHHLAIEDYWLVMNAATGTPYEATMKTKCYNNLASVYLEKKDYKKSRHYLQMAMSNTDISTTQLAVIYNNLGQICNELGNHRQASSYFQKSVSLNQMGVDLEEVIFTFNKIRSLPEIKTNGDSLAHYMDIFAKTTVPIVATREKLEAVDLRHELESYDIAENQQANQKTTLIKWGYILIILALICALVWLFVKYKILPQRRQPIDMQKLDDYISDLKKANKKWDKVIEDHKRFFGIK